ncbi:MAG: dihydroorotase, partial [Chloroflexi bacterium]|nr:dihydroorotase [Chloroflexota bacterium]
MKYEGVRRIDPATGTETIEDLVVEGGRLRRAPSKARGGSLLLAPGFVDLHAHLREPGFEVSETVASGARAALA